MVGRQYDLKSWIDPRVEIRLSRIAGKGMFAREPIRRREIVIVWGGVVLTAEDIRNGRFRKGSLSAIGEDRWLGDYADSDDDDADYTNHSCDPNLWMGDEATLIARREISAGAELTADYTMWEANEDFRAGWECHCGSPICRAVITGRDWRLAALQERYRNHFSPFLNDRIERQKAVLKCRS